MSRNVVVITFFQLATSLNPRGQVTDEGGGCAGVLIGPSVEPDYFLQTTPSFPPPPTMTTSFAKSAFSALRQDKPHVRIPFDPSPPN